MIVKVIVIIVSVTSGHWTSFLCLGAPNESGVGGGGWGWGVVGEAEVLGVGVGGEGGVEGGGGGVGQVRSR